MRALLEAGADVNSSDEVRDLINTSLDQHGVQWGKTVLMYAASRGDTDCVKMLLEYRADVSLRDLVRLLSPLAPALTSLTLQSNKDARDHARTGRNLQEIIPLLLDVTLPSLSSPSLSLCRLSELKFCQKRQRVLQRWASPPPPPPPSSLTISSWRELPPSPPSPPLLLTRCVLLLMGRGSRIKRREREKNLQVPRRSLHRKGRTRSDGRGWVASSGNCVC
jgi:hypothetical protein